MRAYRKFLREAVIHLSGRYPDRWGITLLDWGVRLNIGWVECLVLGDGHLRVLVEKKSAPKGTRYHGRPYVKAPGCRMTVLSLTELSSTLPSLLETHLRALSIAARQPFPPHIRNAHSPGVTSLLSIPDPSYAAPSATQIHRGDLQDDKNPRELLKNRGESMPNRSFLILWQTAEAESWVGVVPSGSVGSHMRGLAQGDQIFVTACDDSEIYLLGAMRITSLGTQNTGPDTGKPRATGTTLIGPFQMIPLGPIKWRLQFESADSPKLSTSKSLVWQIRSRRRLTA